MKPRIVYMKYLELAYRYVDEVRTLRRTNLLVLALAISDSRF